MDDYSSAYTTIQPAATQAAANSMASLIVSLIMALIATAVLAIVIVSMWKVFKKAGQPGWAALIPIYNTYIVIKIADKPVWWLLLLFIPYVNIVFLFLIVVGVAKAFGKSGVFGVFMLGFFGFIGYPMLAFGDAQYQGVQSASGTPSDTPPTVPPTPPVAPPPAPPAQTPLAAPTPPTAAPPAA